MRVAKFVALHTSYLGPPILRKEHSCDGWQSGSLEGQSLRGGRLQVAAVHPSFLCQQGSDTIDDELNRKCCQDDTEQAA